MPGDCEFVQEWHWQMSANKRLECRTSAPEFTAGLAQFFDNLRMAGVEKFFHPHPLTTEEAVRLSNYCGNDLYYLLVDNTTVLGYGMLRGWDRGYEVPSLGIALDPSLQGSGYGLMFMQFLQAAARWRGANRIRLKVYRDNKRAVSLYESLGYVFQDEQDGQLVGFLELKS